MYAYTNTWGLYRYDFSAFLAALLSVLPPVLFLAILAARWVSLLFSSLARKELRQWLLCHNLSM